MFSNYNIVTSVCVDRDQDGANYLKTHVVFKLLEVDDLEKAMTYDYHKIKNSPIAVKHRIHGEGRSGLMQVVSGV